MRNVMLLTARDACYAPLVPVGGGSPSTAHNVHALLEGSLSETAIRSAVVSELTNTPVLSFGASANTFTNKVRRRGSFGSSQSVLSMSRFQPVHKHRDAGFSLYGFQVYLIQVPA
jgi:hypothetical protein